MRREVPLLLRSRMTGFADFGVDVKISHDLPRVRLGAVTCKGARRWSGPCARFPRDVVNVP
jgi:hypothetical protein